MALDPTLCPLDALLEAAAEELRRVTADGGPYDFEDLEDVFEKIEECRGALADDLRPWV